MRQPAAFLARAILAAALCAPLSVPLAQTAQAADLESEQMASASPLSLGALRIGLCEDYEPVSSGNAYRSWCPVFKLAIAKAGNYSLVFNISDDASVVDWTQVKTDGATITVDLGADAASGEGDAAALLFDSSGNVVQSAGGFSRRESGWTAGYKLKRGTYYAAGYAISLVEHPGYSLSLVKSTSLSGAKITLSKKSYDISADDINEPKVTVSLGGVKLRWYTDYRVKYAGKNKVGTATATITGRGLYYGTRTVKYLILPPATRIESAKAGKTGSVSYVTVKWRKVAKCSGYQIRYSKKKSMSGAAKVNLARSKKSATIGVMSGAKKIHLQVRTYKTVKGKRYYSRWTPKKTVRIQR